MIPKALIQFSNFLLLSLSVFRITSADGANHRLEQDLNYDLISKDSLQTLDLYLPIKTSPEPVPLLIYIHGGAWRSGDKAEGNNLELINQLSSRFPHWAISSINYRLSTPDNNVRHPAHNQDVAKAINYLLDRSQNVYDNHQLYLLGHSVGAFMCLSVSGLLYGHPDTPIKYPGAVVGMILIDGIYGLRELIQEYPSYQDFVEGAMGPDGSPNDWNAVSPAHMPLVPTSSNVATRPKILVLHSRDDTLLTIKQSQLMLDHLYQLNQGSTSNNAPKLSIQADFDSVRGDHDELLGTPQLSDRILKWINPSTP